MAQTAKESPGICVLLMTFLMTQWEENGFKGFKAYFNPKTLCCDYVCPRQCLTDKWDLRCTGAWLLSNKDRDQIKRFLPSLY